MDSTQPACGNQADQQVQTTQYHDGSQDIHQSVNEETWRYCQRQSEDNAARSDNGEGGLTTADNATLLVDNGIFGGVLACMHIG